MLTAVEVKKAIMKWPGLYETPEGVKFQGSPVSEVPTRLREAGWRNVSRIDRYDLRKLGLEVVTARYIGGVRPKRFCEVVVARDAAGMEADRLERVRLKALARAAVEKNLERINPEKIYEEALVIALEALKSEGVSAEEARRVAGRVADDFERNDHEEE